MTMTVKREFIALAERLRTAPRYIADYFGVSPALIESLLRRRGEIQDRESLECAIERNYGTKVLDECTRLVGECPFTFTTRQEEETKC